MSAQSPKLQKYSAPALEKGLDILEFLSLTDSAPSLSQLAAGIGRSKSEIFRMMIVLEERGYIERVSGDNYSLTNRVAVLGAYRSLNSKLAEIAIPILQELSEKTKYSCHVSTLDGYETVVIAHASLVTSYGISVKVGHRSQIVNTSAGACFLAPMTSDERADALDALSVRDQHASAQFRKLITQCESEKYLCMPCIETQSISELSAPVMHASDNATLAVVTIPYLTTERIGNKREEIVEHLIKSSRVLRDTIEVTIPNLGLPDLFAGE